MLRQTVDCSSQEHFPGEQSDDTEIEAMMLSLYTVPSSHSPPLSISAAEMLRGGEWDEGTVYSPPLQTIRVA